MSRLGKYLGILVSIVVIITGITFYNNVSGMYCGVSTSYLSSYSFGADFYTEIYNGVYKAVGELNNLSDGLETALSLLRWIAKLISAMMICFGGVSLCYFLSKLPIPAFFRTFGTSETPKEAAPDKAEATAEAPASPTDKPAPWDDIVAQAEEDALNETDAETDVEDEVEADAETEVEEEVEAEASEPDDEEPEEAAAENTDEL